MGTKDVKDYFCRHFLKALKVNSVSPDMAAPQVLSHERGIESHSVQMQALMIEVHPVQMQAQMKVTGANLLANGGISCSSRGFRFAAQMVSVKKTIIKRYTPGEVTLHTISRLKTKAREGMKQMSVLPQERANRLQWQLARPKKQGEVILAWFGPIVEEAVTKLTLNKRLGTLLIWYNPQSRRYDAKGLYLYRRMGLKENLEWRWI